MPHEIGYDRYRLDLSKAWPGFEVVMDEVGCGDFLVVAGHINALSGDILADAEHMGHVIPIMAGALREWSLTLGGQPVPADESGLQIVPMTMTSAIATSWIIAMGRGRSPLPPTQPEVDESTLPMEVEPTP